MVVSFIKNRKHNFNSIKWKVLYVFICKNINIIIPIHKPIPDRIRINNSRKQKNTRQEPAGFLCFLCYMLCQSGFCGIFILLEQDFLWVFSGQDYKYYFKLGYLKLARNILPFNDGLCGHIKPFSHLSSIIYCSHYASFKNIFSNSIWCCGTSIDRKDTDVLTAGKF